MKTKTYPTCAACGRFGSGVQFAIFNPRFAPFGSVCTECEATLPPGTTVQAGVIIVPEVKP